MGTWSAQLDGNDVFADAYETFMDLHQSGKSTHDCTDEVMREFLGAGLDDIMDEEDHEEELTSFLKTYDDNDVIEIFLAIAKAQTDVNDLHDYIYQVVRLVIETGASLRLLKDLGADEAMLIERKEVLEQFLTEMKQQIETAN